MTQTPTPVPMPAQDDDTEITEIQIAPSSIALPTPPPPPSSLASRDVETTEAAAFTDESMLGDEPLDMTELTYYSATESKRLRSRMMNASLHASDQAAPAKNKTSSSGQRFGKRWANLSLRNKFAVLMIVSATVPTVTVTQTLVALNKSRAITDAKEYTTQQGNAFREEYVLWAETDASARSSNLARLVQASGIDPSNPEGNTAALQSLITLDPFTDPETAMTFQIVVDIKGRSIAQDIRLINGNQPVPTDLAEALGAVTTTAVQAPLNQDLRSMPMVQKVLSNGIDASGVESISAELTEVLKLTPQLQQGNQTVSRKGRTLTALSVSPVLVNGSTRGAVIAGQIVNNNTILADTFKLRYDASSAAVFDGEQLVLSTEAGQNGTARQTEAVVSPEAIQAVFERGEEYLEETQRDGSTYLQYYSPIYSHKAVDNAAAKPVGMTYLGQSLKDVESRFRTQQLLAYGLGGGMILLSTLLALPAAGTLVKPLKRLSGFMERLGKGDRGLRISEADRQDEVGVLSLNMNRLAASLENKESRLRTALWQNEILAEVANLRTLDSQELTEGLTLILEKARKKLKLDRLVVYRCGSTAETGRVVYEARQSKWPSTIELGISDSCIPAKRLEDYRQGKTQVNPDVTQANLSQPHLDLLEKLNVKASIITPMVSGEALYGLLVAHSCSKVRNWEQSSISFMESLADRLAAVIGYVTLIEQQRQAEEVIRHDKEILQRRALELLQEVDPVSKGDLTVRAKVTPDEIGTVADSYNATVESLRKIVTQVQNVSTQVTSTAQSNDIAVTILAQDALAQANKITGSLSSIEAMSQSVQQLATQAQEARIIVDTTQTTVDAGEQAMVRTVEGMAGIRESVSETTQKMESLEAASERISNVIRLISGFAAQTHMLAMKASIEAARAGDEGEGFAVIADEVRSLAAQSAQATADVETVINTIQMATQDVIAAMEVENSQVAKQMELVEETRASLTQITAASAEVNQLVSAIAQTTETQTQTSDATAAIITEVAQLVRNTSEEASQVSDSFKQLVDVSQALQAEVAQFKVS